MVYFLQMRKPRHRKSGDVYKVLHLEEDTSWDAMPSGLAPEWTLTHHYVLPGEGGEAGRGCRVNVPRCF